MKTCPSYGAIQMPLVNLKRKNTYNISVTIRDIIGHIFAIFTISSVTQEQNYNDNGYLKQISLMIKSVSFPKPGMNSYFSKCQAEVKRHLEAPSKCTFYKHVESTPIRLADIICYVIIFCGSNVIHYWVFKGTSY